MAGTGLMSLGSTSTYVPQSRSTANTTNNASATTGIVTDIRFESTSTVGQTNVPVTFGQVFAPGNLGANVSLVGRLDTGVTVPLQVDVKAKHADGSVRHAIISAVLPSLNAGEVRTMTMSRTTAAASSAAASASLINAGFTASFTATIDGVRYTASADELIKAGKSTTWLEGANANEWQVWAPLTSSTGVQHPHLTARFAIRWYPGVRKARVDVAVENNWAYEPNPRNFTYDASLVVGGQTVYSKAGLNHYHHARWRKLAWWGTAEPAVNVKHNVGYLIASRAVPNYDQSISISEQTLNGYKTQWTSAGNEPMSVGAASGYMPMTGGRNDIGLLPGWAASYLLSMDKRARDITLGTADLAGSWPTHLRDKKTGFPVSLVDYPAMTATARSTDSWNPKTNQYEAFPGCAGAGLCDTPYTPDTAHQPNFAYVPYLITGDYYYLEELQFWASWNNVASHPGYRQYDKALVVSDQVRGQAWTLRTMVETAYITPDNHPLKSHFNKFVDDNLNWFNQNYGAGGAYANGLGVLTNGFAMSYANNTGIAPWQDDFFTSVMGHALELGFTKAEQILKIKARFPIDRMTATGTCWLFSADYATKVRDSEGSPVYANYAKTYAVNHPDMLGLDCNSASMLKLAGLKDGEIAGLAASIEGQPTIMQPALSYAASVGGADGKKAWDMFQARKVKPDFSISPQFAIVPR